MIVHGNAKLGPAGRFALTQAIAGGMTQKALAGGVPVCAAPFGRDQLEVARRVEVSGAGSRLPPRQLNPRRLQAKVREAIACKRGAERVASAFRSAGGATAAADAIEQRLLRAQTKSNASAARDGPWCERWSPAGIDAGGAPAGSGQAHRPSASGT